MTSPEVQAHMSLLTEENYRLNVIIENYIKEINSLKISITQLEKTEAVVKT